MGPFFWCVLDADGDEYGHQKRKHHHQMPYIFTVESGAEGIRTEDVMPLATPLHVTFFGRCYAWRRA